MEVIDTKNKKYIITSINTTQGANIHAYSCGTGSTQTPYPSNRAMEFDITIQVLETGRNMLRSIEDFEEFLRGDQVHEGAPTYKELLAKHHPEYLL